MTVIVDTNVVLDLLLDRAPFADAASELFLHIERGALSAMLCATTITTIHYLASKSVGNAAAKTRIRQLLSMFELAPVTRLVLEQALASKLADFEDAVLAEAAVQAGASAIITRNGKDFRKSALRIYTPQEWLAASDGAP